MRRFKKHQNLLSTNTYIKRFFNLSNTIHCFSILKYMNIILYKKNIFNDQLRLSVGRSALFEIRNSLIRLSQNVCFLIVINISNKKN